MQIPLEPEVIDHEIDKQLNKSLSFPFCSINNGIKEYFTRIICSFSGNFAGKSLTIPSSDFLVPTGALSLILSTKFIVLNLLFYKEFIADIGWWMSRRGKLDIGYVRSCILKHCCTCISEIFDVLIPIFLENSIR